MQILDVEKNLRNQINRINVKDELDAKRETQLITLNERFGKDKCRMFENSIYKGTDPTGTYPVLQFVETAEQDEMFNYYKATTASIPLCSNMPGRVVKILVQDHNTKTYLGLLQLSTDLLANSEKLAFFEADPRKHEKIKKSLRDNGANISICMPLQPFGFNYCGGKLLSMLAFSKEVHDYYLNKFDTQLKYLITTSIHGKSVQYSRVKYLKFIGYTSGYGTGHISSELLELMKSYLSMKSKKYDVKRMSNHTIANHIMRELKLKDNFLEHGQKRGIYIGLTGKDSIKYIKDPQKELKWQPDLLESTEDIFKNWIEKFAVKRKNHLLETGRFVKV